MKTKKKSDEVIMVSATNIGKTFDIPQEKRETLREFVLAGFKGVRKVKFVALKNINFSVKKGEFFGIIGRNGSGKSTLLKMIAKIYSPDKGGVINVKGRISAFLELGVGFNMELTARENIYLNATILGMHKEQIDAVFKDIINFAEIENFVDQQLKYFSSGMQLRLAFSVAIQAGADVLLLDEVLAVGDANFQQKCFDIFRRFKQEGKTVIFVSHDLNAVRQFCNRVLYLKDGKVEKIGDPNEVVDYYLYTDKQEIIDEKAVEEEKVKPVEITHVDFIDKFGNKNKTILSGDKMIIRVHYRLHRYPIEEPVLGIAVYREDGLYVYGSNTALQNKPLILDQKGGFIEFTSPQILLLEGKFLVTLAFHHKNGTVYDWQDKKFTFYVQRSTSDEGIVQLHFKF